MNLELSELLDSIRDVELLEIKIQKQSLSLTPNPQVGGTVPIDSPNLSLNQSLKNHTNPDDDNGSNNNKVGQGQGNNASILNTTTTSNDSEISEFRRNLRFQEILAPPPATAEEGRKSLFDGSARVKGSGATVIVFLRRFGCGVCRQVVIFQ